MTRSAKPATRSFSVRFSEPERQQLRKLAGAKSLGEYIREQALNGAEEPRRAVKAPVKDADALGRLLGLLGQSRLASNLNQLAKAANQGSLPVTIETEAELRQACREVHEMRFALLQALGFRILEDAGHALPVADAFTEVAGGV